MTRFPLHKVIGVTDPTEIEANGLYLMRTGRGFVLKVADSTGQMLHSMNTGVDLFDSSGFVTDRLRIYNDIVQATDGNWSCDYSSAGFTGVLHIGATCLVPSTNSADDGKYAGVHQSSISPTGCSGTANNAVAAGLLAAMVNTKATCPVSVFVIGVI